MTFLPFCVPIDSISPEAVKEKEGMEEASSAVPSGPEPGPARALSLSPFCCRASVCVRLPAEAHVCVYTHTHTVV